MSEDMSSEKELICQLIDNYADLQRIKYANNPQEEVEYQLKVVKAKLRYLNVPTENLELK